MIQVQVDLEAIEDKTFELLDELYGQVNGLVSGVFDLVQDWLSSQGE